MPQDNHAPAESAEDLSFENAFAQAAGTDAGTASHGSQQPASPPAASGAPPASPPPTAPAAQAAASPPATGAAPAASQQAAAAAATAENPLFAQARAAGVPLDGVKTEADLNKAVLAHLAQISPYAQLGRQALAAPPAAPQPAAPPAPAEKPWNADDYFAEKWKVPEWKDAYQQAIDRGLVQLGENGLYEAADPRVEAMVLPILQGLNEAHVARYEARQQLFDGNPLKNIYDALLPAIERQILAKAEELVSGRFQQVEQAGAIEKFEAEHKGWLYGPDGKFSEHGQKFVAAIEKYRDRFGDDQQGLLDLAMQLVPPPTAAPTGAAAPAAPAAGAAPNPPSPAAPPTPQQSFLSDAIDRASHSPQPNGHQQTLNAPVNVDDAALDSMFVAASKQRAGAAA